MATYRSAHLEKSPPVLKTALQSAPMQSGSVHQGQVFWIPPEALRPSIAGVAHPHVVIQDDLLNASRIPTTIVCGISSNQKLAREPGNVLLDPQEGGLPLTSVVIVSQVSVVEKTTLTQAVGALSPQRVQQVLAGIRFLQTSFFWR